VERPVKEVNGKVNDMHRVWKELGCRWVSPFMTMSLLALSVLPELRITALGLVDTVRFEFVDPLILE